MTVMANTITDLNEYLFAQLDAITNTDLAGEALDDELKRTKGVVSIASTILHSGELALETVKQLNEYGYDDVNVPQLLLLGGGHK